jgi:hypothetical protein
MEARCAGERRAIEPRNALGADDASTARAEASATVAAQMETGSEVGH